MNVWIVRSVTARRDLPGGAGSAGPVELVRLAGPVEMLVMPIVYRCRELEAPTQPRFACR